MPEFNIPISIHLNVRVVVGEPERIGLGGQPLPPLGRSYGGTRTMDDMIRREALPHNIAGLTDAQRGDGHLTANTRAREDAHQVGEPLTEADMVGIRALSNRPSFADAAIEMARHESEMIGGARGVRPADEPEAVAERAALSTPARRSRARATPVDENGEPVARPARRAGRPSNAERAARAVQTNPVAEDILAGANAALTNTNREAVTALATAPVPQPFPVDPNTVVRAAVVAGTDVGASVPDVTAEQVMQAAQAFSAARGMPALQHILQVEIGVPRIRDLTQPQMRELLTRMETA